MSESEGNVPFVEVESVFVCSSNAACFLEFQQKTGKTSKQHNILPIWGTQETMNLNHLILANIQGSSYFKGR